MRNPLFLICLTLLLTMAGAAGAKEKVVRPHNNPASGVIESTGVYDEAAYDWSGSASAGKPSVDTLKIKNGSAVSPLMFYGDCVFIDAKVAVEQEVAISIKTAEDWNRFRANLPNGVSLTACCPRRLTDNPCASDSKVIMADKVGGIRTVAYGPAYHQVFQCTASSAYRGEWQLIGENGYGSCPQQAP